MWLPHDQQSTLTELFQASLIKLCSEHIQYNGRLELDGLVCITNGDVTKQIVMKIHKVIEPVTVETKKASPPLLINNNTITADSSIQDINEGCVENGAEMRASNDRKRVYSADNSDCDKMLEFVTGGSVKQSRKMDDSSDKTNPQVNSCIRTPVSDKSQSMDLSNGLLMTAAADKKQKFHRVVNGDANKADRFILIDSLPLVNNAGAKANATHILRLLKLPTSSGNPPLLVKSSIPQLPHKAVNASQKAADVKLNSEENEIKVEDVIASDSSAQVQLCKMCSVSCSSRSTLEVHMREAHRRFLCKICLNTFTLSCNLRRHMKLHAGMRPHSCKHCDASFSRSTDLRIHMRKHSNVAQPLSQFKTTVRLKCSNCAELFSNHAALLTHICSAKCATTSASPTTERLTENLQSYAHLSSGFSASSGADENNVAREMKLESNWQKNSYTKLQASGAELNLSNRSNNSQMKGSDNDETEKLDDDKPSDLSNSSGRCSAKLVRNNFDSKMNMNVGNSGVSLCRYSEEMQELAPLFNFSLSNAGSKGDIGADIKLSKNDRLSATESEFEPSVLLDLSMKDSTPSAEEAKLNRFSSGSAVSSLSNNTSRSKRKGLPVKFVDNQERNFDFSLDIDASNVNSPDESSNSRQLIESNILQEETVQEGAETSSKLPPPPPLSRKVPERKEQTDEVVSNSDDSFSVASDQSTRVNSASVDAGSYKMILFPPPLTLKPGAVSSMITDSESRVYTCRHGGCSTNWFGFKAYEQHFVSDHYRFPCSSCDQSFTNRNNRRRHSTLHTDAKRHSCETCEKLFARPEIVKEHRLTHTRSYQTGKCRNCEFECEKKAGLVAHLKKCLKGSDVDDDIVTKVESES